LDALDGLDRLDALDGLDRLDAFQIHRLNHCEQDAQSQYIAGMNWVSVRDPDDEIKLSRVDENGWNIYEITRTPRRPHPYKKKSRNGKKHRGKKKLFM
jgi:hypothetical protein